MILNTVTSKAAEFSLSFPLFATEWILRILEKNPLQLQ